MTQNDTEQIFFIYGGRSITGAGHTELGKATIVLDSNLGNNKLSSGSRGTGTAVRAVAGPRDPSLPVGGAALSPAAQPYVMLGSKVGGATVSEERREPVEEEDPFVAKLQAELADKDHELDGLRKRHAALQHEFAQFRAQASLTAPNVVPELP